MALKPPHLDLEAMERVYKDLEAQATHWLDAEEVAPSRRNLARSADLRYAHQGSEVTVDWAANRVDQPALDALFHDFHQEHHRLSGFSLEQPVEIVTLRVTARGYLETARMARLSGNLGGPSLAFLGQRQVYFDVSEGFIPCGIYDRGKLAAGSSIDGPAILQNVDSTVVLDPGWRARIDEYGNCIMRPV